MSKQKQFDARVSTRTTADGREAMERAAARAGLDLGTWARVVLTAAASTDADGGIAGDALRACVASAADYRAPSQRKQVKS